MKDIQPLTFDHKINRTCQCTLGVHAYLCLSIIFLLTCAANAIADNKTVTALGEWVIDENGKTMLDPQTSGLLAIEGKLYSLSDTSADVSQLNLLHVIDPVHAKIVGQHKITSFSQEVKSSCFYDYLASKPDYEAMVRHPLSPEKWIWVTEDASYADPLSNECKNRFSNTGSTEFPTLLVLLNQNGDQLEVEGVRPIQFMDESQVGDFSNDGIEGLAVTQDNQLLLALEKDIQGNPRIFSANITQDMFKQDEFLQVRDAGLSIPKFESGNHPINGMDVFYPSNEQGFLIAAARNDNEIWLIDLNKTLPTRRQKIIFKAPSAGDECNVPYPLNNSSIEGVAVMGDSVFLINDPWKINYHKNIQCSEDKEGYLRYSPLLFKLPLKSLGF